MTNGHGQTDECYETFTEAKLKCLAAGDCKAIATQSNICSGKFRVTHGIPAFRFFSGWKPLNLKTYEYTCQTGIVFRECCYMRSLNDLLMILKLCHSKTT